MPRPPVMPASPAGRGRRRGSGRGAFYVGVEVAQQLALGEQWRDQARALVDRVRPVGPVPQARGAGPACLREPRGDRMQQRPGIFAPRQQRVGDTQPVRADQHQQHALGAAEMHCFVDQRLVQGVAVAKRVQAQAGVDQALNELAWRVELEARRSRNATRWLPALVLRAVPAASEPGPRPPNTRPDLSLCLGALTSTPVAGGVLRRDRVRLRCSCSPCLANGCIRGAVGSRFDAGRWGRASCSGVTTNVARFGTARQEIQPYHVWAPGGGSARRVRGAVGACLAWISSGLRVDWLQPQAVCADLQGGRARFGYPITEMQCRWMRQRTRAPPAAATRARQRAA